MALSLKLLNWRTWLRSARVENSVAILSHHYIYILPTRYGWFFALMLLIMLLGSINYMLSLGFVLVFLLTGAASMAMLHTWRNLAHLHIRAERSEPVFAGENAVFEVLFTETRRRSRYAIATQLGVTSPLFTDIPAGGHSSVALKRRGRQRGWLPCGRIKLYTEFPLALFHAWAYVDLDSRCLIYPRPAARSLPLPTTSEPGSSAGAQIAGGDDDFFGHRSYHSGDSPKRIDWKASSKEQGLLTKQFQGRAQNPRWLDWSQTPGNNDEQRISQLTRWVIDADHAQQPYGLRLPGQILSPAVGKQHYHQCLQALALM